MSRRWNDEAEPGERRAAELVALAATVGPRHLDLNTWDGIVARAVVRRDERLLPAFVLSVALGAALAFFLTPRPSGTVADGAPVLVASAGAVYQQTSADRFSLSSGRLAVNRLSGVTVIVETPRATIRALRCRFLAEVTQGGSTVVVVEEGEALVRTSAAERTVRAGQTFTLPAGLEIPQSLVGGAGDDGLCAGRDGGRASCLEREARGDGREAEAALYELGRLRATAGERAGALEAWRRSLERFPRGVLHPEVRLSLLVELVRLHRYAEADHVAKAFEEACADDPRRDDVARLRASLGDSGASR